MANDFDRAPNTAAVIAAADQYAQANGLPTSSQYNGANIRGSHILDVGLFTGTSPDLADLREDRRDFINEIYDGNTHVFDVNGGSNVLVLPTDNVGPINGYYAAQHVNGSGVHIQQSAWQAARFDEIRQDYIDGDIDAATARQRIDNLTDLIRSGTINTDLNKVIFRYTHHDTVFDQDLTRAEKAELHRQRLDALGEIDLDSQSSVDDLIEVRGTGDFKTYSLPGGFVLFSPALGDAVFEVVDGLGKGSTLVDGISLTLFGYGLKEAGVLEDAGVSSVVSFLTNSEALRLVGSQLDNLAVAVGQEVVLSGVATLLGVGLLWKGYEIYQSIDGLTGAIEFAASQDPDNETLQFLDGVVDTVNDWFDADGRSDPDYVPEYQEMARLVETTFENFPETLETITDAIKEHLRKNGDVAWNTVADGDVEGALFRLQLVAATKSDASLQSELEAALFNSDALSIFEKIALDPTRCFPAGTQITMWDRSTKPVEKVSVSDLVLCFDETGFPQPGYVSRLFRNITTEWMRLDFADGREPVHVTPGHRFLTETGHYMEIGHMVRLGGGAARVIMADGSVEEVRGHLIQFNAGTAELFEQAALQNAVGASGSQTSEGWQTYNFEVRSHHNYVAENMRVHNDSIFAFLEPHEYSQVTEYRDTDNDSFPDYVLLKEPGVATEKEKSLDGSNVVEEITTSDGRGNIIYQKIIKDSDGNVIARGEPQYLSGQFIGEGIGRALTPFLTDAILGEDASAFEEIASNTVLGTVLENVGGTLGALIDRGFITNYGEVSIAGHFDTIAGGVFEDFGGELIVNGIYSITGTINQLVMAETFEFIDADGIPGAVYRAVIGAGVANVVSHGAEWLTETDTFASLFGFNTELLEQVRDGVNVQPLPDGIGGASGWASLVLGAVVREILPPLESTEAQIASAITGAVLSASTALSSMLSSLGAFSGPVGAVITWAVGALVDAIFDEDPEAWTNVGFDAETGRFVLTGTWSDDGGDTELSKALAQAYVNGMNGFVDTMMSQSHNYGELARWSFGHYEESLKNAGSSGQTFSDFQNTYLDAYIRDLAAANLGDGQMTAVRALNSLNLDILVDRRITTPSEETRIFSEVLNEDGVTTTLVEGVVEGAIRQITIEGGAAHSYDGRNPIEIYKMIASALQIAEDYHTYLENTEAINALIAASPNSAFAAGWYVTLVEAERMGLADSYDLTGSGIDNQFFTGESADTVSGGGGDDLIKTYLGDDVLQGDAGDDILHGGAGTDQLRGGADNDSLEGGDGADIVDGGDGTDWATFATAGTGVTVNLFAGIGIAGEAEGDTYIGIENLRGSLHDDKLKGDAANNVIEAGGDNDTVWGHGGDDTLYGQAGNDLLFGDLAEDTSVSGNDLLFGGAGDDILHGGGGFDAFDGGEGHDRVSYRYSTLGVIASLISGEAKINGGIETFTSIEGLIGSAFTDYLYGDSTANTIEGLAGNDVLNGGEGGDTYQYKLGDGNDLITDWDNDAGVVDRLVLRGINADDVSFASTSGEDLVITLSNGERITIADHFAEHEDNSIEQIEFADGTVLNTAAIRNKSVADQKESGSGSVIGSDFAETYTHALGDGSYTINDWDNDGRTDRLVFSDVNAADVSFASTSGEDLVITLSNGERITVRDHFAEHLDNAIEQIEFADGEVLNLEDIRNKSVADQKESGSGSVTGSDFAETYTHALGDGSYTINDWDNNGRTDRLVFSDVNAADVSFASTSGEDLVITLSNGERITVRDHFAEHLDNAIEQIEFADGEVLNLEDIRNKSVADQKESGSGSVTGSDFAETYTHALGDGTYRISDWDNNERTDRLVFSDLNRDQLVLSRFGDDLRIILPNGEYILIAGQLGSDDNYYIESFEFADGTVLSAADMAALVVAPKTVTGDQIGTDADEAYSHASGDGSYAITDYDYRRGADSLTFSDLNAGDVTVGRTGNNVLLSLSNGEQITLVGQLNEDRRTSIETITFADGTSWTQDDLRNQLVDDMKAGGTVIGTENDEAYTHALGDGSYSITDYDRYHGNDTLTFTDVNASDVTLGRSGNDLIFTLPNGEQITLLGQLNEDRRTSIETITFADGTSWTQDDLRNQLVDDMKAGGTVIGTENDEAYTHALGDGSYSITDYDRYHGNDTLTFTDANASDVTLSRSGNDLIFTLSNGEQITLVNQLDENRRSSIETVTFADGTSWTQDDLRNQLVDDMKAGGTVIGTENDEAYTHALGDGSYSITDYDRYHGNDTLTFTDANASDVTLGRSGNNLIFTLSNGEQITLVGQLNENLRTSIETITFADGTTWTQQELRNRMVSDMKVGGTVIGTENDEAYTHALGDGSYSITDYDRYHGNDRLKFTDVNADDVTFSRNAGQDLVITLSNGEIITIIDHFRDTKYGLELIAFADGTVLDVQGIRDKVLTGGSGNDILTGWTTNDTLTGNAGNDQLDGGAGNDKLDGGLGDDFLTGGLGADEFIFKENLGSDTITDFTDVDLIRLGITGVTYADLTITDNNGDAQIAVGEHGTITLEDVIASLLDEEDFIFL